MSPAWSPTCRPAPTTPTAPPFRALAGAAPGLDLLLATYFEGLRDNLALAASLPVTGLHVDLVRAPGQLPAVLEALPRDRWLSLGLVDGRNVWRTDLRAALAQLRAAEAAGFGKRLMVAPSCSLLHVPHSLAAETALDPALRRRLAFANEKLKEVAILARAVDEGEKAVAAAFEESDRALAEARSDARLHDAGVAARLAAVTPGMERRASPYPTRTAAQAARLGLPELPVTSIGSWPQTAGVRNLRARLARGEMDQASYDAEMERMTAEAVRWQEEIGVDVPVHGEFERNDMVKYFGEQLSGYAFTKHGWVQSYGSRCVAPPIIWADVSRPAPMTVRWSAYAQSLTSKPMKGMLTGPVTMLQWSFVRADIPRETACRQIALAIRDEAADLEKAGIPLIQIDEPAFREGLPLRQADRADYLRWAVACFRLSASAVRDETQIHTHMCYSEFNDIIESIAAMDADVISIETARSDMELLEAFAVFDYPNEIGPGVWDIHSPARAIGRGDGAAGKPGGEANPAPPALAQPGLRLQDARLGRGEAGHGEPGRRGTPAPRRGGVTGAGGAGAGPSWTRSSRARARGVFCPRNLPALRSPASALTTLTVRFPP